MYKLSPYVWEENGLYRMLIRAVNPSQDITQEVARIYYGESKDGIHFKMDDGPVIAPGVYPESKDGVEDPTVVCLDDGYLIYYTGWNLTKREGQLLFSKGMDLHSLQYYGKAMESHGKYLNPKEATVSQLKDGKWVLFFEYADENRSRIGKATSDRPHGPWTVSGEYLKSRDGSWDSWHMSAGPMITDAKNESVMFYNGSNELAHWRVGWVTMDSAGTIKKRSEEPLITPKPDHRGKVDIAFAASAIAKEDEIWLYYATQDQHPFRALIEMEGKVQPDDDKSNKGQAKRENSTGTARPAN
jgi:predicted GH43/DUF377 family glycosyl hydrolase